VGSGIKGVNSTTAALAGADWAKTAACAGGRIQRGVMGGLNVSGEDLMEVDLTW
jgi:hypothetical protein